MLFLAWFVCMPPSVEEEEVGCEILYTWGKDQATH